MSELAQQLEPFGADVESLRVFEAEGPELLPYATLLAARAAAAESDLAAIAGVYEWQNEPLIFLVDAGRLHDQEGRLRRIRRLLAMRGDAPYLGVVAPGRLDVYRIGLDRSSARQARIDLHVPAAQNYATLVYLANERPGAAKRPAWISEVVLKLLTASIDGLREMTGPVDAISLVGRALFTRFLADRGLLPAALFPDPSIAFDDARSARKISDWLDGTFNGDLLQLTPRCIENLPEAGFKLLGDILRRASSSGQLYLGWEQRWDYLDFAHIPVGVLSQVYENYLRTHTPGRQRREGGYYTPRGIADLMVRTAFHALGREQRIDTARVLDPAAGAGIFLLTAFRELVAARWRRDGVRPDTRVLRDILYRQITGFDSNEEALRFAALGLYLISIELDPSPEPVQKLGFEKLEGSVLHKVSAAEGDLGSLGLNIGAEHRGAYDVVLGNPPWTTGTRPENWRTVQDIVSNIARERFRGATTPVVSNKGPRLPNNCLDLPFLWRAMEWAKPRGQIALALHARLLFQQGDGMPQARHAIFSALDVTAVINGAELRSTKVWPNISAPFCFLFAINQIPGPGAGFRFVTPRLEAPLNNAGSMRIDAANAQLITSQQVLASPHLLKLLFRGTQADVQIYEKLRSLNLPTLKQYWTGDLRLSAGNGYQRLRRSSPMRDDDLRGYPADELAGLPEFTPEAGGSGLAVKIDRLEAFSGKERLHRPRSRSIFRGPLLIVHKSPAVEKERIGVWVAEGDVLFNETFYGYSAHAHRSPVPLVRFLALILSSKLALWLALMTSGEFGFEREVVEKSTIDNIAIPDFDSLSAQDRAEIDALFEDAATASNLDVVFSRIDVFAARQYAVSDRDLQVIKDTLTFNLPFSTSQNAAQRAPDNSTIEEFCHTLRNELYPWATRYGRELAIEPEADGRFSPGGAFTLRSLVVLLCPSMPTTGRAFCGRPTISQRQRCYFLM